MALHLTDADFTTQIATGVTVVDFWAEWCGPCRMLSPIIDELSTDYGDKVKVGKMDVDNNSEIPMQFNVRSIPTVLFFKDGKLIDKHVGYAAKPLLAAKVEALLNPA
jgi:thioredoxin 1